MYLCEQESGFVTMDIPLALLIPGNWRIGIMYCPALGFLIMCRKREMGQMLRAVRMGYLLTGK